MLKIKQNTDLNQIFLETKNEAVEPLENQNTNIIVAQPKFETPMRKSIYNHEILFKILNHITEINFDLIIEEAECLGDLKDEVEGKSKVSDNEKVTIILECLLHVSETLNSSLICENGIVYLFNGSYYEIIDSVMLKIFLGEVAAKSGVPLFKARSSRFGDELYRQFAHAAVIHHVKFNKSVKINLLNGTLHLQEDNFELKEHIREDFFKYKLSFDYDPEAKAPLFENFLNTVLPEIDSQKVLMEYLGYVLTRNMKLEKILIILGTGSNGKSVLFDVINALLGPENISTTSMNYLCDNSGYYRPALATKLLNYTNEFGGKIDLQIFKKLVSGEPIDGRLPFGNPITITDYCKFIINSNNLPNVEHSHAFFRRQLVIPFKVTIKDSERDIHLAQKIIRNELSGILNLILAGLKRLISQDDFSESLEITQEINKYKLESNTVSQFLEEEGWEHSTTSTFRLKTLYEDYVKYCRESNLMFCSRPNFYKRLRELNFIFKAHGTNNYTDTYIKKKDSAEIIIDPNEPKGIKTILDIFKS